MPNGPWYPLPAPFPHAIRGAIPAEVAVAVLAVFSAGPRLAAAA
jgi:hypothetical protein